MGLIRPMGQMGYAPPLKKIEKFSFVSLVLLVLLVPSLLLAGTENDSQTTKRWAEFQSTASLEPISGFEPETPSLRVKCSTTELNRQQYFSYCDCKYRKIFSICATFSEKFVSSQLVKTQNYQLW